MSLKDLVKEKKPREFDKIVSKSISDAVKLKKRGLKPRHA